MACRSSKPFIDISETDIAEMLTALCAAEVFGRGGGFEADKAFIQCVRTTAQWLTRSRRPSLMLIGQCGNGKTTLARALCTLINDVNHLCVPRNGRVWQYSADALVKAAYGKLEGKESNFHRLKNCPILMIDDLGIEAVEVKEYGNSSLPMVELLSHRYDHQLCTIATTNESVEVLGARYGSRIQDRINEAFAVIPFCGTSFRK